MKRYFYKLLFMAVAFISAAMMGSCVAESSEDSDPTDKYSIAFVVNTNNPKVKESEAFKAFTAQVQATMKPETDKVYYLTDFEAKAKWLEYELKYKNDHDIQNLLDARAKDFDDTTLSCSLKMLKNGQDWKHMDWTTWYHGY